MSLTVEVYRRAYGASPIMPPGGLPLSRAVTAESVRVSWSVLVGAIGTLTASPSESLRLSGANTVTTVWTPSGFTAFNANAEHATLTNYQARLRLSGSGTVLDTRDLGVPTPDGNNVIVVDLSGMFAAHVPGNYTVSIAATSAGGTTDSAESNVFVIPVVGGIAGAERLRRSESVQAVRT